MLWRPIFGWERDTPKGGLGSREFEAYFRFGAPSGSEEYNNTFLFFLGFIMFECDSIPSRHVSGKQDQGAMRVNCQGFRRFVEFSFESILAADFDGNLYQHSLAASPAGASWPRIGRRAHDGRIYML